MDQIVILTSYQGFGLWQVMSLNLIDVYFPYLLNPRASLRLPVRQVV